MTEPLPFRQFAEGLQGITRTVLVRNSSKQHGATLPSFLHMSKRGHTESQHVGLPDTAEERRALVETAVVPLVREIAPEVVGWTFEGVLDGDAIAVVLVIDRERSETWYAPLARVLGQTLIGDWIPWAPNEQAGTLLTPIQEAMR
jgi:hypothetical protein